MAESEDKPNLNEETFKLEIQGKLKLTEGQLDNVARGSIATFSSLDGENGNHLGDFIYNGV